MELDGNNLSNLDYDELIEVYNVTKNFISYLDNQIQTSEVEKK